MGGIIHQGPSKWGDEAASYVLVGGGWVYMARVSEWVELSDLDE